MTHAPIYPPTNTFDDDLPGVLEPEQLNDIVEDLDRRNVVWIKGTQYHLIAYTPPTEDRIVHATLRRTDIPF